LGPPGLLDYRCACLLPGCIYTACHSCRLCLTCHTAACSACLPPVPGTASLPACCLPLPCRHLPFQDCQSLIPACLPPGRTSFHLTASPYHWDGRSDREVSHLLPAIHSCRLSAPATSPSYWVLPACLISHCLPACHHLPACRVTCTAAVLNGSAHVLGPACLQVPTTAVSTAATCRMVLQGSTSAACLGCRTAITCATTCLPLPPAPPACLPASGMGSPSLLFCHHLLETRVLPAVKVYRGHQGHILETRRYHCSFCHHPCHCALPLHGYHCNSAGASTLQACLGPAITLPTAVFLVPATCQGRGLSATSYCPYRHSLAVPIPAAATALYCLPQMPTTLPLPANLTWTLPLLLCWNLLARYLVLLLYMLPPL